MHSPYYVAFFWNSFCRLMVQPLLQLMQRLKHALEADPSGLCEEPTVESKRQRRPCDFMTFHGTAKIGHDLTDVVDLTIIST